MTIQQMIEQAQSTGRSEYANFLVTSNPMAIYKDQRLLLQVVHGEVNAFQAWTRSDATVINAALETLHLERAFHCTWSGNGPHLVHYDGDGNVLNADTPESLIRRLYQ